MRTSDVITHYGTQTAVARDLGILQSSVSDWGEYPPDKRQLQLERRTAGQLKAEPGCYERLLGLVDVKAV